MTSVKTRTNLQNLLSKLPKIDTILKDKQLKDYNLSLLKKVAQDYLHSLREKILKQDTQNIQKQIKSLEYGKIIQKIEKIYKAAFSSTLRSCINATGVVAQTNLGRSIFSPKIIKEITPLLCEYNNLEYDITKGQRGERYKHISEIICGILGCEDVLVVNNNAAAVLLIINTFAKNKEVIISRGELIEVGGNFRIPEVIISGGGILKEVGSTNKTHLNDYEEAICETSSLIIKVHQSNFEQIGFTREVQIEKLIALAHKHNLIDYYDIGSGYLKGILDITEPSLQEIASLNPSLVSFSGDKLFGGPQAGIIFGKKHLIDRLKKNHLLRALRVDKFSIFTLQATLKAYLQNDFESIPTIAMLNEKENELYNKATKLFELLSPIKALKCELISLRSKAGGGSLPTKEFPSYGLSITHSRLKTSILNDKIRQEGLIARIQNNNILLDMRCLMPHHFIKIQQIFQKVS